MRRDGFMAGRSDKNWSRFLEFQSAGSACQLIPRRGREFRPPYPHWHLLSALTLRFSVRRVLFEAAQFRIFGAFCEAAGARTATFFEVDSAIPQRVGEKMLKLKKIHILGFKSF